MAAPLFGEHPPGPTLTLRIGVTGPMPKPEVPVENFGFVRKQLRAVFDAIADDLPKIAEAQSGHYSDEAPKVRLVSALAEGAAQMAAEVMPNGWTLDAILPFPAETYRDDFKKSAIDDKADVTRNFLRWLDKAETQLVLPGELSSQDQPAALDMARARLGGFLLRQIDVLVAVWNGQPEQGKSGTLEIIRAAISANIPVAWIRSDEDSYARMIENIERDGRIVAPEADCLKGALAEAIDAIVRLSEPEENEGCPQAGEAGPNAACRLQRFLRESWPKASIWVAYDMFKRVMEGKKLRCLIVPERQDDYAPRWRPLAQDCPAVGPLNQRIDAILLPRFAWADALALDYSHRYRTTYIVSYFLAALAVFVALSGLLFQGGGKELEFSVWPKHSNAVIEIVIILSIIYLVRRGRRRQWKERWMEYRTLAELLVHVRFLAYLGEHGRAHRLGTLDAAHSSWLLWYLRATIRETGLPSAQLDGAYQRAMLSAVDKHVLVEQEKWHRENALALRCMEEMLHNSGVACFIATLAALVSFLLVCVIHTMDPSVFKQTFFGYSIDGSLPRFENFVTFFAAFLPSLGSALAGIRETGDFGKVAERSSKTAIALKALHKEIAMAKRELVLDETGDALLATAKVLTDDLAAWQSVYGHKRLELPA